MKLTKNNRQTPPTPTNVPLTQRRLKTKPALTVMAVLLLGNLFWFILWVWPSSESSDEEIVATIDGEKITKQQWMAEMEELYGQDTLKRLVDEEVMKKAAEKYDIKVSDEEIDLELALMRSAQDTAEFSNLSEEQLRQAVRSQLILEKVLSKDVIIEEDEIVTYYEENEALYNISTSYRTSVIVVESKTDAESVVEELADGSEFEVMARERSKDNASSSLGGDIGFITANQETVDAAIRKVVGSLKTDEISEPIELSDGSYAIVQLNEIAEGQSFSFEDVKEHVAREMAMEQLSADVAPEVFWADFEVEWFYGEEK